MLTDQYGWPCTKFVVPSSGSQYQVRRPACPPDSSATTGTVGVARSKRSRIRLSLAKSNSVTRSRARFSEATGRVRYPRRTSSPASRATSRASSVSSEYSLAVIPAVQAALPQHFLYFLPLPHGQASLRPTLGPSRTIGGPATSSPSTNSQRPFCFLNVAISR